MNAIMKFIALTWGSNLVASVNWLPRGQLQHNYRSYNLQFPHVKTSETIPVSCGSKWQESGVIILLMMILETKMGTMILLLTVDELQLEPLATIIPETDSRAWVSEGACIHRDCHFLLKAFFSIFSLMVQSWTTLCLSLLQKLNLSYATFKWVQGKLLKSPHLSTLFLY